MKYFNNTLPKKPQTAKLTLETEKMELGRMADTKTGDS